ncbi:MAG: hypothetical protein GTO02_08560, partial [Candidatus Dadabacteria bacterium]|nr:hypothetical protein [Candidatus Dadabacteria bacterium]
MERVIEGLLPELEEYCFDKDFSNRDMFYKRTFNEGKAPIIATNPPMATGFLADRILVHLLGKSSVKRNVVDVPEMPGYLYFDAAKMEAKKVEGSWWKHKKYSQERQALFNSVQIKIAETEEELDEIYRLRYDTYCHEMHSLDAKDYPDKRERDWYDQYSVY